MMADLEDGKPRQGDASGQKQPEHDAGGAPTDKAHEAAGDGSLAGSVPAGLTVDELRERAASDLPDSPGSE